MLWLLLPGRLQPSSGLAGLWETWPSHLLPVLGAFPQGLVQTTGQVGGISRRVRACCTEASPQTPGLLGVRQRPLVAPPGPPQEKTSFPTDQPLGPHHLHRHPSNPGLSPYFLGAGLVPEKQEWELPLGGLYSCCSLPFSWTSPPLRSGGHVGGPSATLAAAHVSLPLRSALSDSVPEPACLPGLVPSRQQQGSGLWPLDPVVCDLHPLCLPLLVPTHL